VAQAWSDRALKDTRFSRPGVHGIPRPGVVLDVIRSNEEVEHVVDGERGHQSAVLATRLFEHVAGRS
jgi:hypothetical protein